VEYLKFKTEYLDTLRAFLNCSPADNYPNMIFGAESSALSSKLADMEEEHPDWVERIEDSLAAKFELQ